MREKGRYKGTHTCKKSTMTKDQAMQTMEEVRYDRTSRTSEQENLTGYSDWSCSLMEHQLERRDWTPGFSFFKGGREWGITEGGT